MLDGLLSSLILLVKLVLVFTGGWSTHVWSQVNNFHSLRGSFFSGSDIPLAFAKIQVSAMHSYKAFYI